MVRAREAAELAAHRISSPPIRTAASPYSDDTWHRVAVCETGAKVAMHGSRYSTAFGVMNGSPGHGGVVDEADSPASAARMLAGTASYAEELRMAKREAARFGIAAWAHHTLVCAGIG